MNLIALPIQVDKNLPQPHGLRRGAWNVDRNETGQPDTFGVAANGQRADGISNQIGEIHVRVLHGQYAGFDFGKVQYVVEQFEQRFAPTAWRYSGSRAVRV